MNVRNSAGGERLRSCVTYITRGDTLASPSTFSNTAISRIIFSGGALWQGRICIAPRRPDNCFERSNAIDRIPVGVSRLCIPARRCQFTSVRTQRAGRLICLNTTVRLTQLTGRPTTIPHELPTSLVYYPLHGCGLVAHHTKRTVACNAPRCHQSSSGHKA